MSTRILQLTDLHLFTEYEATLRGVPTRASLVNVLEFIQTRIEAGEEEFDCLIITGDLAHDELATTYAMLSDLLIKMLGELGQHCLVIPGNHDNRDEMRRVFGQSVLLENDWIGFSREIGGWRLIGLDSHISGEVGGRINSQQLVWLKAELTRYTTQPTILFLHHPPVLLQSRWLDSIGFQEPRRFTDVIHSFPQVRIVSAGHVHQEYSILQGDVEFMTTPSTAAQFCPRSREFTFDNIPPGYRVFELSGDRYTSHVKRLPVLRFPPDSLAD